MVPLDRVFGSYFDENGRVNLLAEGKYGEIFWENWWWLSLAAGAVAAPWL